MLSIRILPGWVGPLSFAFMVGCSGTSKGQAGSISESQALDLAVAIANKECMSRFARAPFDRSSYPIEFKDGRWWWGRLDLAGEMGFSASVSFDARGKDPGVEVYFSADRLQPSPK